MPLLKRDYYILSIDLPGHGLSSHIPHGIMLHFTFYMISIIYVVKHLKIKNLYYVGHSFGAHCGLLMAAVFPQLLKKLIVIDYVAPSLERGTTANMKSTLEGTIEIESYLDNATPKVFSSVEALNRLMNKNTLTPKAAEIVMDRRMEKVDGGYVDRTDLRLKPFSSSEFTREIMMVIYKQIKCPVLFIMSSEWNHLYEKLYDDLFECIRSKPNMHITVTKGNHEVHQNYPERIVDLIEDFFAKERSKL